MARAGGLDRLRYEVRLLGPGLFALPLLVLIGLGALAGVLDARHVDRRFLAQLLTASLEACLPLTTGLLLAHAAAHDPAVELLLTLPPPYRFLALRRCALLLGWTALLAVLATAAFQTAFPWALPALPGAGQLIWLAPTLAFGGAGALLALVLRSRAAGGAVLCTLWVSQLAFPSYFASTAWAQPAFLFATLEGTYELSVAFWLTNRLQLLAGAAILFLAVWWYLRHPEWRFHGEDA